MKSGKRKENKEIRCVGCDGWPIDNGSAFVQVFLMRRGEKIEGWICELCWLKRLQHRGGYVNCTSPPHYQIDLPELDITRHPLAPKPKPFKPVIPPRPPRPITTPHTYRPPNNPRLPSHKIKGAK
jgi:hypothetical protein